LREPPKIVEIGSEAGETANPVAEVGETAEQIEISEAVLLLLLLLLLVMLLQLLLVMRKVLIWVQRAAGLARAEASMASRRLEAAGVELREVRGVRSGAAARGKGAAGGEGGAALAGRPSSRAEGKREAGRRSRWRRGWRGAR